MIGISLIPEASWLSVLLTPLLIVCSPFIITGFGLLYTLVVVLGGATGAGLVAASFGIGVGGYSFLISMAIFGEIILIPMTLLSLPAWGSEACHYISLVLADKIYYSMLIVINTVILIFI